MGKKMRDADEVPMVKENIFGALVILLQLSNASCFGTPSAENEERA
jgi:hypothetical protein